LRPLRFREFLHGRVRARLRGEPAELEAVGELEMEHRLRVAAVGRVVDALEGLDLAQGTDAQGAGLVRDHDVGREEVRPRRIGKAGPDDACAQDAQGGQEREEGQRGVHDDRRGRVVGGAADLGEPGTGVEEERARREEEADHRSGRASRLLEVEGSRRGASVHAVDEAFHRSRTVS
jgi:hypothetical protein